MEAKDSETALVLAPIGDLEKGCEGAMPIASDARIWDSHTCSVAFRGKRADYGERTETPM